MRTCRLPVFKDSKQIKNKHEIVARSDKKEK